MDNYMELLFEGLKLRPPTKSLVVGIILNFPLEPQARVDFGVDSEAHYRALESILLVGDVLFDTLQPDSVALSALRTRILALEDALGNGPKLNALVRRYAPGHADFVHFRTRRDES